MKITIGLFGNGVGKALKDVQEYKRWIQKKTDELAKRLSEDGYSFAFQILADHIYSGETVGSLRVEQVGPAHYIVRAESKALLFLEYGAGLVGYGHPEPGNYGPGTYPGKGHWDDPNGWWFETDDPNLAIRTSKKTGKMWGHSYGTKAYAPMYNSVKSLKEEIQQVAQEVFSH